MSKQIVERNEVSSEVEVMDSWTSLEKENSRKKYGCDIMIENGSWEQVNTKECPNDARIVTYEVDGEVRYDLTRSQKAVNIFNMYWDKFREGLKSIEYGQGNYNPKLWGAKPPETKKRK